MDARRLFLLLCLIFFVRSLPSAALDEAARRLAARVAIRLEPRETVMLSVRNASSLAASDVSEVRAAVEQALAGRLGSSGAEVRVTLSENLTGYLWVAEIQRGGETQVAMLPVERARDATAPPTGLATLEKKMIREQEQPILDAAVLEDGAVLVLEPGRASLHLPDSSQSAAIASALPWPRDLRGRLVLNGDAFHAYLPGVVCTGKLRPTLELNCRPGDTWPVYSGSRLLGQARFASGRNFFEGPAEVAAGGKKDLPAFFSAAGFEGRWLLAGLDGRLYLDDDPVGPAPGDLAGVESSCGSHSYLLMTRRSERSETDSVQGFEITDRHPSAVSEPVEFAGPVTALWPAAGGDAGIAVARDPKTGRYAAFRVAIRCSR